MRAHGSVVDPPKGNHDRPESTTAVETSATTGANPSPGHAPEPRFREHIGNVKTAVKGEGGLRQAKASADGSSGGTNKAVESEPWLRVGTPSEGDLNHVAQVQQPNLESKTSLLARCHR